MPPGRHLPPHRSARATGAPAGGRRPEFPGPPFHRRPHLRSCSGGGHRLCAHRSRVDGGSKGDTLERRGGKRALPDGDEKRLHDGIYFRGSIHAGSEPGICPVLSGHQTRVGNSGRIRYICVRKFAGVAQLVRAPDCGSGGHRFESYRQYYPSSTTRHAPGQNRRAPAPAWIQGLPPWVHERPQCDHLHHPHGL